VILNIYRYYRFTFGGNNSMILFPEPRLWKWIVLGKVILTLKQKRIYFTKPTPCTTHKTTKYKKGRQKILPSEAVPSVKVAGRNPIKSLRCAVLNRWASPADKYTVFTVIATQNCKGCCYRGLCRQWNLTRHAE
jgi:hypothetical protein